MKNIFTEHPNSIGESYFEHFKHAIVFAMNMFIGSLTCLIHAFFPFVFKKTGSDFLFKTMHIYIQRMSVMEERVIYLSQVIAKKSK